MTHLSKRLTLVLAAMWLCASVITHSQSAREPAFEVVGVRANTSGSTAMGEMGIQPGGRWLMINGTVQSLVTYGYTAGTGTPIVGLPAWTDTERFDVIARAAAPSPARSEMFAMVRQLLVDRFGLRAHFEEREQATYSLVLVNKDKLGPRLRQVTFDCDALVEAVSAGKMQVSDVPKSSNGALGCASAFRVATSATGARVVLEQHGGTRIKGLADSMRTRAGRPVLDKTGLDGFYEYTLEYASDPLTANSLDNTAPSYFTALAEQLGLRIVSDRGLVRALVIDAISRPASD